MYDRSEVTGPMIKTEATSQKCSCILRLLVLVQSRGLLRRLQDKDDNNNNNNNDNNSHGNGLKGALLQVAIVA